MLGNARLRRSAQHIRRCLACGYGGQLINPVEGRLRTSGARGSTTAVDRCPHCGCDFGLRPPRSYAEMENLAALDGDGSGRLDPFSADAMNAQDLAEGRLLERWIAFLFLTTLIVIVAVGLLASLVSSFGGALGA